MSIQASVINDYPTSKPIGSFCAALLVMCCITSESGFLICWHTCEATLQDRILVLEQQVKAEKKKILLLITVQHPRLCQDTLNT
jgi:hypothetical protein